MQEQKKKEMFIWSFKKYDKLKLLHNSVLKTISVHPPHFFYFSSLIFNFYFFIFLLYYMSLYFILHLLNGSGIICDRQLHRKPFRQRLEIVIKEIAHDD